MALTVQNIIDFAYLLNAITSPGTTDRSNGLLALNSMLNSWSGESLVIYAVTDETFTLTVSQGSYTIGSGGDFNTVRPQRIIDAFIRDSNSVDHKVDVEMTLMEYNDIDSKSTEERPDKLYYATEHPLGKIYFNYVPSSAETLHLSSWKPFTEFSAIGDTVTFPPEYEQALKYNLAPVLAAFKDNSLPKFVYAEAEKSKNIIEALNVHPVETIKIDKAITYTLQQ